MRGHEQPLEGMGMLRLRQQIEQAAATVVDDHEDHVADLVDDEAGGVMQKREVSGEGYRPCRSGGGAQSSGSKAVDPRGATIGYHLPVRARCAPTP